MANRLQNSVSNTEDCVGCFSCEKVCSRGAIQIISDELGFSYPNVDESLCCNCGLCAKKCPVSADSLRKSIGDSGDWCCYAAYSKNDDLRRNSSSGGIFSEMGKAVIESGGVVYGAQLESGSTVRHVRIATVNDLSRIRKSKYLPSNIGQSFLNVETDLKDGLTVLFSGTPCQIAGLKSYLGGDSEHLYTVDVLCHGVPSPKVFGAYLLEKKAKFDNEIDFRNKQWGWNDYNLKFNGIDGEFSSHNDTDSFMVGFIKNLYLRQSCYQCRFNRIGFRQADISLGDFWGCEKRRLSLDCTDNKGVSVVLVNTKKGRRLFELIREAVFSEKVGLADVIAGNPVLEKPCAPHKRSGEFLKRFISGEPVSRTIDDCCSLDREVLIINHSFSHNNFGAVLVAFAMEKLVSLLGFSPQTLRIEDGGIRTEIDRFKDHWLHQTEKSVDLDGDWRSLNDKFHYFIVGSDQVWRNWFSSDSIMRNFFLDFAERDKSLIAYAASFGIPTFEGSSSLKRRISRSLQSFVGISVRESEGVVICRDDFGVTAQCVLDPTLVVGADAFEKLSIGESVPDKPYLAYMIFKGEDFDTGETNDFIDEVASRMGVDKVDLFQNGLSVEKWIALIKNARFVITDSYHGMLFSVIFRRQFLCLANMTGGETRFTTVGTALGIEDRIKCSVVDLCLDDLLGNKIDYNVVKARISPLRAEAIRFLSMSLAKRVLDNGRRRSIWQRITVCGVPMVSVKVRNNKARYYLFGFIRFYSKRVTS